MDFFPREKKENNQYGFVGLLSFIIFPNYLFCVYLVMTLEAFILKIEEAIDTLPKQVLKANTNFRSLPEWSSMHALIIIAMVDIEYNVSLSGDDLKSSQTIADLFDLVKSRTA